MGTSCCGGIGAGCPPPPPPLPPPLPPPPPPPGGAPGPVLHKAAARAFLRRSSTPGWVAPLAGAAGAAGAVGAAAAVGGPVQVEVVVTAAVVEPMLIGC